MFPKEFFLMPAYRIYRGDDPDLVDIPIPKTEDMFDKMDGFGARLKYGAWAGWATGTVYAIQDIMYLTKLTDRRAQILRYTYLTAPALFAGIGFVAGLEIAKKYNKDAKVGAYGMAAAVPAGVLATWRRDPKWFPKTFIPIAAFGMFYAYMVKTNQYTSAFTNNPNDPTGAHYKANAFANWPHKVHIGPKMEFLKDWAVDPQDPGPTYTKWENK